MERRTFLQTSVAVLTLLPHPVLKALPRPSGLRFGMITDLHYADRPTTEGGSRYYRQSLGKLREAVDLMNGKRLHFMIELGDLKDQSAQPSEEETLHFLKTIESEYAQFNGPRHYVLGNHDHDSISKEQFLQHIQTGTDIEAKNYYSFTKNGYHCIILDSNYSSDGRPYDKGDFDWTDAFIPQEQTDWLREALSNTELPALVFVHHRLDNLGELAKMGPSNSEAVRQILEESRKVLAVFQGHHHAGGLQTINNIHYYTLKAVVEGDGLENNNYAIVEVDADEEIKIKGYRKTDSTVLGS
ncbi:metallophosphoesterase [Membranihabitans marinus]|uniref:metallophosphoesterase n=1 Tax=Membranihabitans marinus TaxID=1227546 RepID=UPI001F468182|nr:metallophosphoesterase [Membranihabitans marinus]